MVKRMLDCLFSTVLLVLFAPLLLIIGAVLVKLTSPGPVFFRQNSCGFEQTAIQHLQVSDHGRQR